MAVLRSLGLAGCFLLLSSTLQPEDEGMDVTDDRERHVCLGPYHFDDAGSRDDCLTSVIASTTDIPDFASTTEPTGPFRTYRSGKLVRVADCRSDACLHWLQTETGLVWYLSRRSAEIPWPRMDEAVAQSFGLRLATDR